MAALCSIRDTYSVLLGIAFLTIQASLIDAMQITDNWSWLLCQSPKWWKWLAQSQLSSGITICGGLSRSGNKATPPMEAEKPCTWRGFLVYDLSFIALVLTHLQQIQFLWCNASKGSLSVSSLILVGEQCPLIPVCGLDTNHVVRMVVTEFPIHVPSAWDD